MIDVKIPSDGIKNRQFQHEEYFGDQDKMDRGGIADPLFIEKKMQEFLAKGGEVRQCGEREFTGLIITSKYHGAFMIKDEDLKKNDLVNKYVPQTIPEDHKKCRACGGVKKLTEFWRAGKNSRNPDCIPCAIPNKNKKRKAKKTEL